MRRKTGFLTTIIGLLLITTLSVYAQANAACPTLVQESYTATEFLCESVPDGQACIGNGVVSTTPIEASVITFANPGEIAPLAQMQRFQLQTLNTDTQAWTSVIGKLDASQPNGETAIMDMLVFGDVVVSNAVGAEQATATANSVTATVEAAGGVIVRQNARVDSNNIWQLVNAEEVTAIGRSQDNQWVRIIVPSPNGGAGWVFGQFLNVAGGREVLPFQTDASPIPAVAASATDDISYKPMQAFRLESLLTDPACAETTDSGVILQSPTLETRAVVEINGVEMRIRGTVFVTAQTGDKMTVYNLEGETAVIIDGERSDMTPATVTEITLDASLAPTGTASDVEPYSQDVANQLVFLPVRLLSRDFEVSFVDPALVNDTSTDTTTSTDQTAPPPPVATETPPEETIDPSLCPTLIQESYTATEFLCEALSANTACIGNAGGNMIVANPRDGVDMTTFVFASPGDIVPITDIATLQTRIFDDPNNVWSSILMTLDANTTTGATAQATIAVVGEVNIENTGEDTDTDATSAPPPPATSDTTSAPPPPPATTETDVASTDGVPAVIQAPGGIIVRAQPRVDSETSGQLQDGDPVNALGRSVDQQWVQIQSPTITGWVFVQFVTIDGGVDDLPIIDPNTTTNTVAPPPPPATNTNTTTAPPPATGGNTTTSGGTLEFTSMQSFEFSSTDIPNECVDSTPSGILIQSPDDMDGDMRLRINTIDVELNGTVFVQAEVNVETNFMVIEGEARVTAQDTTQSLEAGQQTSVRLANNLEANSPPNLPSEYSFSKGERLPSLPLRLMPRAFEPVIPPEPQQTTTVDNNDSTSTTTTGDDVVSVGGTIVDFGAECEISAGDRVRNLRADAGPEFDVINTLQPGQSLTGVSQKRGPEGLYWYETTNGWIRSDAGVMSPDCENLPLFGVIYDTEGVANTGSTTTTAPVAPPPPPQPTAPPPPPGVSDVFGNVCGQTYSGEIVESGRTFYEFGGVWTGQGGTSITFVATVPYYRSELGNIITFVNEDGSQWLGSLDSNRFTVNFDSTRRFSVRVSGLLGDFVSLQVIC